MKGRPLPCVRRHCCALRGLLSLLAAALVRALCSRRLLSNTHHNVARLGRRPQLKRDLGVSPYGILRRRASADCYGRSAALRAKALAPDRHPDAKIFLSADVWAAFKIGEEDAGRGLGGERQRQHEQQRRGRAENFMKEYLNTPGGDTEKGGK